MTDKSLVAHAYLLGSRLETRGLEQKNAIAYAPLTIRIGSEGYALVFRYGAVVFIDVGEAERTQFIEMLGDRITEKLESFEPERAELILSADGTDSMTSKGEIVLKDTSPERLQVIAHILAKNAVLSHYEARIASVIDRIEPLAENLRKGRSSLHIRDLLREMGQILLTQHRMIGRVEIVEKPDVLWDHPELERLYARLEDEYELRERNLALDRKLTMMSETVRTLLDFVQDNRSHRVEWYIVLLIVLELALSLYEMGMRHLSG